MALPAIFPHTLPTHPKAYALVTTIFISFVFAHAIFIFS